MLTLLLDSVLLRVVLSLELNSLLAATADLERSALVNQHLVGSWLPACRKLRLRCENVGGWIRVVTQRILLFPVDLLLVDYVGVI